MAINKKVSLGRIGIVIEGDFDSTKAYKRLSLVKVPLTGDVYISKTDIPANTEITDERWYKLLSGNEGDDETISNINAAINNLDLKINNSVVALGNRITALGDELSGFMVWGQAYNNANNPELLVGVPNNIELENISGILFKSPRDGYSSISVVAYTDNIPTGREILNIELDNPLFQGNVYCIAKVNIFGGISYIVTTLHDSVRYIESIAYLTKNGSNQTKSLMINAMANVKNMANNVQYNFHCVNCDFAIDLFACVKVKSGNSTLALTTLDGGDPNTANYRRLVFTDALRIMFHIGGYYKNVNVKSGNYYDGTAGNPGTGSRFSENYSYPGTYNEAIDNDIPLSIPQLYGRDNVSLSQFIIPRNTKFTIILLPNMDASTGNVTKTSYSKCPYSMMFWFDDFEAIIRYNNNGVDIDSRDNDPIDNEFDDDE